MADDLFIEVTATPAAQQLAADWPELGIGEILNQEVDKVARLGQAALRSKVPIKTGELRDEQIVTFKPNLYTAQVLISGTFHKSSRGYNPPAGNVLAMLLNLQKYRRSQPSRPEPGFSPAGNSSTQNWIEEALSDFDRKL